MSTAAAALARARRVVVKLGSAQLMDARTGARTDRFDALAADLADLRAAGRDIVLVSSGAVALGRPRLGFSATESLSLEQKQACAAAGQARLIQMWDTALAPHGLPAAQALLTPADTEHRPRWLNARATLETLISRGAVPVINENDTVATQELRFGDNDRLAARTAQLVGADLLVLLSDVDGLYTDDPKKPGAAHLSDIPEITPEIEAMAGPARAGGVGTGGMASKIAAAKIAAGSGCAMIIARGDVDRPLAAIAAGAPASLFHPSLSPESARRAFITGSLAASGRLILDAGAHAAVLTGKSLLPAGVTAVEGRFRRGEAVVLAGPDGRAFAAGIAGYDDHEARAIAGRRTAEIEAALGYRRGAALVHAGDVVLD
ncbi:MAG: glutamate 5-kinase [Oceanicaulis sp.]